MADRIETLVRNMAIGLLVAVVVALACVVVESADAGEPGTHWRLEAVITMDGKQIAAKPLNHTQYKSAGACVQDGLMLGAPPPTWTDPNGHHVTYSIACFPVLDGQDPDVIRLP